MIRTLQSLRFLFIMLVVLSHYIGKSFDFGGECGISKTLQCKTMLWLGNISFCIYLIHAPVLRIFNSIFVHIGIDNLSIIHFSLFTIILIVLSHLSYIFNSWIVCKIITLNNNKINE